MFALGTGTHTRIHWYTKYLFSYSCRPFIENGYGHFVKLYSLQYLVAPQASNKISVEIMSFSIVYMKPACYIA